jgi:CYTH domain-containing protein
MNIENKTQIESTEGKEIEKKFIVKKLPENLESFPKKEIRQGYVSISEDGTEVRVRQKNNKFYHTTKSTGGLVRKEVEKEITQEEFDTFWAQTEGRRVEKTRYEIPLENDLLAELDIYHGDLDGLQTVEVEFHGNNIEGFTPPDWFGDDVTENRAYKNANLALKGLPQ